MIKFRTDNHTIDEVEVIRETDHMVYFASDWSCYENGRPEAKRSKYRNYFDTWQEARQFLIDRENNEIARLMEQVRRHQEARNKIQEMHKQ